MTTHWIKLGSEKIVTHCGMEGWRSIRQCDPSPIDEFDTLTGGRFEASRHINGVDCKKCLKIGRTQ